MIVPGRNCDTEVLAVIMAPASGQGVCTPSGDPLRGSALATYLANGTCALSALLCRKYKLWVALETWP